MSGWTLRANGMSNVPCLRGVWCLWVMWGEHCWRLQMYLLKPIALKNLPTNGIGREGKICRCEI